MPYKQALMLLIAYGVQMTRWAEQQTFERLEQADDREELKKRDAGDDARQHQWPHQQGLDRGPPRNALSHEGQRGEHAERDGAGRRHDRDLGADHRRVDELVAAGQVSEPAQGPASGRKRQGCRIAERPDHHHHDRGEQKDVARNVVERQQPFSHRIARS
jgi:hypothetical protein